MRDKHEFLMKHEVSLEDVTRTFDKLGSEGCELWNETRRRTQKMIEKIKEIYELNCDLNEVWRDFLASFR